MHSRRIKDSLELGKNSRPRRLHPRDLIGLSETEAIGINPCLR